jgi:hypothetical protein
MSDDELIDSLKSLVAKQSRLTADLLFHIAEVETRKLHLAHAYSSMFKFCVEELGLSESMAYKHITVARAARKHEAILAMVKNGQLHLSTVLVLLPHLTDDNCAELLEAAKGRSKRQVEKLIARRFPKADAPSKVRKLPEPSQSQAQRCQPASGQVELGASAEQKAANHVASELAPRCEPAEAARTDSAASPVFGNQPTRQSSSQGFSDSEGHRPHHGALGGGGTGTGSSVEPASIGTTEHAAPIEPAREQRPRIEPLSAARYKVQFTANEQLVGKLRQAQELLRRQLPDGDPAVIFERALDLLIESLMKKRFALSSRKSAAAARAKDGDKSPSTAKKASSEPEPESERAPQQDVTDQRERVATSGNGAAIGSGRRSRYIPASVRRQVAERDGLQCSYVSPDGRRCESRDVEFHHLTPFARGGQHTVEEITLRCRAHNAFQAELDYGQEHIKRRIRQQRARSRHRRADRDRARPMVDGAP